MQFSRILIGLMVLVALLMVGTARHGSDIPSALVVLPSKAIELFSTPTLDSPSLEFKPPVPPSGTAPVAHVQGGSNGSQYHVIEGENATRMLPRRARDYHPQSGPNATVSVPQPGGDPVGPLMHVESGPEESRLVPADFVHASIPASFTPNDQTRYFPPHFEHKDVPGPMQTVYVGDDWVHMSLTTAWVPPGGTHLSEPGPDSTKMVGGGGGFEHIFSSPLPAQISTYVTNGGPAGAKHIIAGPDETKWEPNEHHTQGYGASSWLPNGWGHNSIPGPFQTEWHPPGWEHKPLGPQATIYLPQDYTHATQSPPSTKSDPFLNPDPPGTDATSYLPPGWTHASEPSSPAFTTYVPPGFAHVQSGGGTWPNTGAGLTPGGRTTIRGSDYIGPGWTHVNNDPTWPDYTAYVPNDATHVSGSGPSSTYFLPTNWVHLAANGHTGLGQGVAASSYVEPGWQHQNTGSDPTLYTFNP